MRDSNSPTGRTVLVTGGSKGIGRAIVRRFADNGDHVVAVARDAKALAEVETEEGRITTVTCDVTDERAVLELFKAIDTLDVLICNAGASDSAPLTATPLSMWNRMIEVNATAVFLTMREGLATMLREERGRIIVVASTAGRVGSRYISAYAASKHAAVGLMRAAASEVAGTAITVNAVCPGFVDTPMTDRSIEHISEQTGRSEVESREALARTIATQSPSRPGRGCSADFLSGIGVRSCDQRTGNRHGWRRHTGMSPFRDSAPALDRLGALRLPRRRGCRHDHPQPPRQAERADLRGVRRSEGPFHWDRAAWGCAGRRPPRRGPWILFRRRCRGDHRGSADVRGGRAARVHAHDRRGDPRYA